MKKIITTLVLMASALSFSQVGLGTTSPHASAQLEVSSINKGFLPPRMTQAQRNAIPSPTAGLILYCTNCGANGQMQMYDGTAWTDMIGGTAAIFLGTVASLNCAGATNTGTLTANTAASGVSTTLSYTGGNEGTYEAQTITSTGVTGLTATLVTGTLASGAGTVTYIITGTPSANGIASFAIAMGGQTCTFTRPVGVFDRAYGQTINGANNHNFVYSTVTGADGNIWLNNNLGAHYANVNHASFNFTQQATSATDHLAYGSLFQWGRAADGHELITYTNGTTGATVNGTTTTKANIPANALYILRQGVSFDWRTTQDDTLWATEASANNPCPVGYKVPTIAQLTTLVTASSITNSATAATSAMKFTAPGARNSVDGSLTVVGSTGYYWSNSVSGTSVSRRYFNNIGTDTITSDSRASGATVRCIKD
jgi:uncharacterized protein (TIGR02145 family)